MVVAESMTYKVPSPPPPPPPPPPFSLPSSDQYLGSNGQPCSLSAILSPLSLAASMQVDSQFSPSHLSSLTFSFQCKSLQATLLHAPNHAEVKGAMFEGYHVVSLVVWSLRSCSSCQPGL